MKSDTSIKIKSRVKHVAFGTGTVVRTNDRYVTVLFDDGEEKNIIWDALSSKGFLVESEDPKNEAHIKNIQVAKLFDRLDYDIEINTQNCVSILSAPNGCGKTTIFKMVDFIFSPTVKTFFEIKSIPFERFSCQLTNGYTLSLIKEPLAPLAKGTLKDQNPTKYKIASAFFDDAYDLVFSITDSNNKTHTISFCETAAKDRNERFHYSYYDDEEIEELGYMGRMGMFGIKRFFALIEAELCKKHCKIDVDFIVANRLQKNYTSLSNRESISMGNPEYDRSRTRGAEKVDYLQVASDEMVTNIKKWVNEYNSLSEIAKRKLPSMYIEASDNCDCTFSQFEGRWNQYHWELQKFYELGILESQEAIIDPDQLSDAFKRKKTFLMKYLDAFEVTLAPLQENYAKLKLFADIFHKRNEITQKRIRFTSSGIEIFSNGKKIDIDCLSSGEKNDFVMFYRLIFNTSNNGIVLVDEPEISLHIEWQEEYLDRLIEICQMKGLQAIVATHSPNIVSDHFDLFVDKR